VNLLENLFGSHPKSGSKKSLFNWLGQSGKAYPYQVFPIDTVFKPVAGNFIYARQSEDGGWIPIYIAQTRDLHQRLEGHVTVDTAIENGATHIHAHFCTQGQAARCEEERDLIHQWQPVCNDPIEG
jgi:hypothetical protein